MTVNFNLWFRRAWVGCEDRQAASVSDQQYEFAAVAHCRTLQTALASGSSNTCVSSFLGIRENAVMRNFYPGTGKTQIWVAVSTYVLIAIVKKELHLQASLYTLRQILSVSVFEKIEISCALQPYTNRIIPSPYDNQLMLLDF